jgi:serine/threonine protein kinase
MLSPTELISFLVKGHFLSTVQGDSLYREQDQFVSTVQLCGELVQRQWLTPYQQAQLLSDNQDKLIIGSYRIQCPLGEGGMGMVYKAHQPKLDRLVALKVIRPQILAARPDIISRFHREARAIAQLNHPNVVLLYDADEANGIPFIAMEFVDGVTLEKMVRTQGPLPFRQACEYIRQSALGLQHAHEMGLVHRDIKPSNILVSQKNGSSGSKSSMRLVRPNLVTMRDRERHVKSSGSFPRLTQAWGQVKLLDLGLARLTDTGSSDRGQPFEHTPLTRAGALLGTPDFISPEQGRDARLVDIRSDLYSLGCTLYYTLTGKSPFPGGTDVQKLIRHQNEKPFPIDQLRPGIPEKVVQILNRLLEKLPGDRYQSPQLLADAFDDFLHPDGDATLRQEEPTPSKPKLKPAAPVNGPPREPNPNSTVVAQVHAQTPPRPATEVELPLPASARASATVGEGGVAVLEQPSAPVAMTPAMAPMSDSSRPTVQRLTDAIVSHVFPDTIIKIRPTTIFTAHAGMIGGMAISPDQKHLATAGYDGRVRIWEIGTATPKEVAAFPRPGAEFHSVIFAPNDNYVIVGGTHYGTARIWRWDWTNGRITEWGAYQGDQIAVTSLAFSKDGKRFAAAIGPFVVVWKVNGRTAGKGKVLQGHAGQVQSVAFTEDGNRFASAGEGPWMFIWEFGWFGSVKKKRLEGHTDMLTSVAFSPDMSRLASVGMDRALLLWDAERPRVETSVPLFGNEANLKLVRFVNERQLVAVGETCQFTYWDSAAAIKQGEIHLLGTSMACLTLSPDNKQVALGARDGKVSLYDLPMLPTNV